MEKRDVVRPWGSFRHIIDEKIHSAKILRVKPNKRLSLQYHERRSEFWMVVSGKATVKIGDEEFEAAQGDEFVIPVGTKHRITTQDEEMVFMELWLGDGDESDNVRLEDDYGRKTGD